MSHCHPVSPRVTPGHAKQPGTCWLWGWVTPESPREKEQPVYHAPVSPCSCFFPLLLFFPPVPALSGHHGTEASGCPCVVLQPSPWNIPAPPGLSRGLTTTRRFPLQKIPRNALLESKGDQLGAIPDPSSPWFTQTPSTAPKPFPGGAFSH